MKLDNLYEYGAMPIHIGASLLCGVLLLCGWALGLGPLMSDTQQATTVIEQAEQTEHEAKRVKDELSQLSKELATIQTQLNDQPVSLQSASQINPLLSELARWSELHRLSITQTRAGRPEALAYYDYVPIKIAGEGSYTDLLGFFNRMHNERGDLGMVTFGVRRMATGSGVHFELDLAWYVVSDDAQENTEQPTQATAAVQTP